MKDFAEEVKINRFKLEEECERHVSLYHYYSRQRADTKAELDTSNDKLKLTLAEIDGEIRNTWDENKDGKRTEGAITNKIESSKKIIELKEKIRNINKNLYILDAAVYALDHRKSMLDNLVTLLVKGFYSAPHGGKQESSEDEASREIRSKLKGKK